MIIATRQQALALWNGGSLQLIGEAQGLLSNTVDCLMKDPTGGVWIGTSLGLQQLLWDSETASFRPGRRITTAKGLPSNEVDDLLLVNESHMLVATNDGLAILHLPWMWQGAAKPIVAITAVQLGHEMRTAGSSVD